MRENPKFISKIQESERISTELSFAENDLHFLEDHCHCHLKYRYFLSKRSWMRPFLFCTRQRSRTIIGIGQNMHPTHRCSADGHDVHRSIEPTKWRNNAVVCSPLRKLHTKYESYNAQYPHMRVLMTLFAVYFVL
jgi:hypothetical protein